MFIRVNCATGNMGSQFKNCYYITRLSESEEAEEGRRQYERGRRQPKRPRDRDTMVEAQANPIQLDSTRVNLVCELNCAAAVADSAAANCLVAVNYLYLFT